jgi:hypothetical protein
MDCPTAMLKFTLLPSQRPLHSQVFELTSDQLQDTGYRIGNGENCQIYTPQAKEVTGRLFAQDAIIMWTWWDRGDRSLTMKPPIWVVPTVWD